MLILTRKSMGPEQLKTHNWTKKNKTLAAFAECRDTWL